MADERDVPPLPRVPTAIRETLLAPAPELPRYPTVIRGSMPEGGGSGAAADAAGGVDPDAAVRIGAAPPKFPSLMDVGVDNAQAAANALPVAPLAGDLAAAPPVPKFPSLTDVGVVSAQAAADAMGTRGAAAPMSPIAESPYLGRPSDMSMRSEGAPSFDSAGRSASTGLAATRSSDVYADTEGQEVDHAPGDQIIDTDGEDSSDVQVEDEEDVMVDDDEQDTATGGGIVSRGMAAASAAVAAAGAAVGIKKSSPEEVEEVVEEDYEDVEDDDNDDAGSSEYSVSRDGRSLASGSMRLLDTDDEGKILGDAEGKDSDTKAAIAASGVAAARAVEARLAAQELADDVYSPVAASRATRFSGLPSETDSSSVNESEVEPLASGEEHSGVRDGLAGRHGDDDSSDSDGSESTSESDPNAAATESDEPSTAAVAGASAAALASAAVLGTHVATREARTTDDEGLSRVHSTTIETETVAGPGPDGKTMVSSTSTFTTRPGETPPPPYASGSAGDGGAGDDGVSASRSAPPAPLVESAVVVPASTTAPPPLPTASPYSSTVLPGTAPVATAPPVAGGSQVLSPTDERSVAVVDGSAARAAEVHVTHDYALSGVHEMGVNDGVFLDVNTLATAGADGKVCVWDVDSATVKLQFTPFDNSEAVAVVSALPTAPGAHPQLVCMSARSRLMRIWTLTPDAAVLMSSMQLPRNEKDLIMTLPVAEPAVAEAAVAAHTAAAAAAAADAGATGAAESSEEASATGEEDDLTSEEGSETYLTGDDQMPSGEEDEGVPTSAPGAMQSDRYSAPVSV
ncbi:hypothetical protein MMPV_008489 [Pyropia vietnamensis]